MKALVLLTTAFVLILSATTFAQNKSYYHKNTFHGTFTNCEQPPTFGSHSSDLQKYFADKLRDQITKTNGKIKISVLIDTAGKTACEWIENNSNFSMERDKLNLLIDAMPNWNSAIQNGHKVNCVEQVVLTFKKEKLVVTNRIGRD